MVTSGCDGCAGIDAAALGASLTIAVCVLLITEYLDAACVEAFEEDRFDVVVSNELGKRGQRYRFVVVDANGRPHVDCGVHEALLEWTS